MMDDDKFQSTDFVIDAGRRTVTFDGRTAGLTDGEFMLLVALSRGETARDVLEALFPRDANGEPTTIAVVYMSCVAKKLTRLFQGPRPF